jgi:transposase InsO family protein
VFTDRLSNHPNCRRAAEAAGIDYPQLLYSRIQNEASLASLIPVRVMCRQAGVSRAGFYRWRHAPPRVDADLDLREQIQRIALESPCYGSRRVTAELRRSGWTANHKRVRRIMREDNLLCLRRKKFAVTSNSHHDHPVYPNLAASMVVTDINSLGRKRPARKQLQRIEPDDEAQPRFGLPHIEGLPNPRAWARIGKRRTPLPILR